MQEEKDSLNEAQSPMQTRRESEGTFNVPLEDVEGLKEGGNVRVVWNVSHGNIVYISGNKQPTINLNSPPSQE